MTELARTCLRWYIGALSMLEELLSALTEKEEKE